MSRLARGFDYAIMLFVVVALIYMTIHRPYVPVNALLPGGKLFVAIALAGTAFVVVGLVLSRRSVRRSTRWLTRTACLVVVALLTLMARGRLREVQLQKSGKGLGHWPPIASTSLAAHPEQLKSSDQAAWAARIAAHLLVDSTVSHGPLVVPTDWPFPNDVEIGIRDTDLRTTEIWARAKDGVVACFSVPARPAPPDSGGQQTECEKQKAAPPGLVFTRPERGSIAAAAAPDGAVEGIWAQYRADPAKSGMSAGDQPAAAGWRTTIDGPIRSSVSVAGTLVLVGAHGTGTLAALDLATGRRRWTVRLPNWVHQDPVTDGRIAVVGFGNNSTSMSGSSPSGVVAYDLQTGRRLWTQFEETSVMTSPIIRDSSVTYASAAGMLRKRRLQTGELLAAEQLPGGVIMGPPASTGDTIGVSLDASGVCAVLISTLNTIWCRTVPGLIKVGHAGPTISNGAIIVSGLTLLRGISFAEFWRLPFQRQRKAIWTIFGPDAIEIGQEYLAFDLHSGQRLWTSRLFRSTREVEGHTSGTAVIARGIGVIVLPVADTLVGFTASSGTPLWTAGARGSRGGPLVVGNWVILAGRDGVIDVRDLSTGDLKCSLQRTVGYDRAGPTLAGGLVIFANLKGEVEAIPVTTLIACTAGPPS